MPRTVRFLMDTRAYQSCIDGQLAQQLQLRLVNQQFASAVGGQITLNVYLACIAIPVLGFRQTGTFTEALLTAAARRTGRFAGLIGTR